MQSPAQADVHRADALPSPRATGDGQENANGTLCRAAECMESTEVFQSLRDHMGRIQDEYCTPWKWIPRKAESTEVVKQYLLDYAADLYAAAQQVDRCYFQLAVHPDRMPECVKVLAFLDEESANLYEMCESLKEQLGETKLNLSNALEEKERLDDLLREKTKDAASFQASWNAERALRIEFEQKYHDTDGLLQCELLASAALRHKVGVLHDDLLRTEHEKRERTVRAIAMIMTERREGMLSTIFSFMMRVLKVEKVTRLQQESEDGLNAEIRKLTEQRGSLTQKLHDVEDALVKEENEVARLQSDRVRCGERVLKRAFSPLDARELKTFTLDTWIRCMSELKLETKLQTIGPAYDKLSACLAATEKREKESIANEHASRLELEELRALKKKERQQALIMQVLLLVKFQCERTRTIRELKDAAQKRLDFACEGRDERIMTLVKRMREDSDLVALQTQCSELEWELAQSLRGPPSKVVPLSKDAALCSSCRRQVMYQDYVCAKRGSEDIGWDLPSRVQPRPPEMSVHKRLHRAWQP